MQSVVLCERVRILPEYGRTSTNVDVVTLLECDATLARKILVEEATKLGLSTNEDGAVVVTDQPTEKVKLRVQQIPDLVGGLPGYLARIASRK